MPSDDEEFDISKNEEEEMLKILHAEEAKKVKTSDGVTKKYDAQSFANLAQKVFKEDFEPGKFKIFNRDVYTRQYKKFLDSQKTANDTFGIGYTSAKSLNEIEKEFGIKAMKRNKFKYNYEGKDVPAILNRVSIPLYSKGGVIVGFEFNNTTFMQYSKKFPMRAIIDDLNDPTCNWGQNVTAGYIKSSGEVLILPSYVDVIKAFEGQIKNVVSLSNDEVSVKNFIEASSLIDKGRIVVGLKEKDPMNAKILEAASEYEKTIYHRFSKPLSIMVLPANKTIEELLKTEGRDGFLERIAGSLPAKELKAQGVHETAKVAKASEAVTQDLGEAPQGDKRKRGLSPQAYGEEPSEKRLRLGSAPTPDITRDPEHTSLNPGQLATPTKHEGYTIPRVLDERHVGGTQRDIL